jgi:preprotein translocase subunit YajC
MPEQLLFLGLMVGVFYFLLIRPQQRRQRQHRELISSLAPGDEVITVGGIYGRVKRLDERDLWLEVADGTVIRVSRQGVGRRISPEPSDEEAGQVESE